MRLFEMPDSNTIDLDSVVNVGKTFINKNYPQYNCYEIFLLNGASFSVFESDLSRDDFVAQWSKTNVSL